MKIENDLNKIEKIISEVAVRLKEIWGKGEGDLSVEVRNDTKEKRAKIKSGIVERI